MLKFIAVTASLITGVPGAQLRSKPTPLPPSAPSTLAQFTSQGGILNVSLTLDSMWFSNGKISFSTRAYNGQIPAPTLKVYPGDTLVIKLTNNLEANGNEVGPEQHLSVAGTNGQTTTPYQHPNSTNLHTHGLHVSPRLGSDNVLDVLIAPGDSYTYTYHIPSDHMPGTFWYHPHLHGSTLLQTGGGAAGFIIVEPPPALSAVYPAWMREMKEHNVMLQTVPFSTMRATSKYSMPQYAQQAMQGQGTVISNSTGGSSAASRQRRSLRGSSTTNQAPKKDQRTAAAEEAVQRGSELPLFHVSDETSAALPANWNTSKAPTVENNQYQGGASRPPSDAAPGNTRTITNIAIVNGDVLPQFRLVSGEWQLWRILHAGPFLFMDLTLEPMVKEEEEEKQEAKEETREEASDATEGQPHPVCELQLLAKDGVYLNTIPRTVGRIILPPGGRADVAVRCVGSGQVRLVSGARPGASGEWNQDMYWNPNMAVVEVGIAAAAADAAVGTGSTELTPFTMPRPPYLHNLVDSPASDVAGTFTMRFRGVKVVGDTITKPNHQQLQQKEAEAEAGTAKVSAPLYPHNGDKSGTCVVNGHSFARGSPIGYMKLNTIQEWRVENLAGHPLHLHVNPFQITQLDNNSSRSSSGGGGDSGDNVCDAEYGYTCIGDWLDTLQLPTTGNHASNGRFRFFTDTFTGHEVLHCHYLNHEDLGCITYFQIKQ